MAGGLFDGNVEVSSRPGADRRPGANRFKIRENSVSVSSSKGGELFQLKDCRCGSRYCQRCAPVLGRRVLQRLLAKAEEWKKPRLVTLTVDRTKFTGPADAYKCVAEGRYVARLMKEMGITRWVKVLEFQMKTGEGWPHWHLLVDEVSETGKVKIDKMWLSKAWHLWRDTWGIGGLDITPSKRFVGRPVHEIMRYVVKYMTKFPEKGFPGWVLDQTHVRALEASRVVGALVSGCRDEGPSEGQEEIVDPGAIVEVDRKGVRFFSRTIRERVSSCGESSLVLNDATGKFVSMVSVRSGQVAIAAKRGLISGVGFQVRDDGWGKKFLVTILERSASETVEEMLERVQEGVALLLHQEGETSKSPSYKQEGDCDSETVASDPASVTALLDEWKRMLRKGTLYASEWEADQGAIAVFDDTYLRELIEEEEKSTTEA